MCLLRLPLAVLLLLPLLSACVIDTVEPDEGPADGELGGACDGADDCDADLVCPAGGPLAEHCAAVCEFNSDCTIAVGDGYYCLDGLCMRVCRDTCSLEFEVQTCSATERCVPHQTLDPTATDCLSWCVP